MADKHVSVAEFKRHLSDIMAEVVHTKRRVIVERRGRPMVALVPLEEVTDALSPGQHLAENAGFGGEIGEEFWEIMQEVVRERHERMPRPLPEDEE